jgi:hypothetical protein
MKKLLIILLVTAASPVMAFNCPIRGGEEQLTARRYECYENRYRHGRHVPAPSMKAPKDAMAQCRDGLYSFSEHHPGTCSGHGGVSEWLR